MNVIIQTIREYIADQNVRFVFPSGIAAGLWARKTCTLGIARSVAANRFLAWDGFKEEVTRTKDAKRKPASSVTRKLFAEALVRKNAEAAAGRPKVSGGGFPLKSLIPVEYAGGGEIFVPFIARLLPSLSYWEKMTINAAKDAEDLDYILIKHEYSDFLDNHSLFEPSWEEIKIPPDGMRYVLFFPELIEDFAEYDTLLKAPQFTRITNLRNANLFCDAGAQTVPPPEPLVFFRSAREEIRSAVMELQKIHEEEGIPYEDMAISVPELEEMEPCLIRELSIRHVPFVRRAGKKLGQTGAGRLFSLVNECAASRFSFNSLKALILNDHIPWKEREKNKALIDFGIKYNCVSGYEEDGVVRDIWEEAFKEARASRDRDLMSYYRGLKKNVLSLANSESFADLRKYYFAFRGGLLDMEEISEEDDAVLSRCVEELISLIELEETLGDITPASPSGFFVSHIDEIAYVRNEKKSGINIYPWRVAAASPFGCHFALNASQSAASVLYQPLRFLRQDKRKSLGVEDSDATWAFFLLCDTGDEGNFKTRTRVSASAQTFSGWAIPHSFFAQGKTVDASPTKLASQNRDFPPEDPYAEERNFWRNVQRGGGSARLGKIFPLQKKSFDLWKSRLVHKESNFSFFDSPFPADTTEDGVEQVRKLLEDAIHTDGYIVVAPTKDLNDYYYCSMYWLYSRVFGAEEFSLEAALLDDISLGILYHRIMEALFTRIKQEDVLFDSKRLDTYKRWALEITGAAIKEEPAFRGPLAYPLVSPQTAGMAARIAAILELEAEFFDGYRVGELEFPVSDKTGGLFIRGKIDRISISPDGEPVIFDYKTSYIPKQTPIEDLGEVTLSEFQMPLYVKLREKHAAAETGNEDVKVRGAFFYSINKRKIQTVMGKSTGGRSKAPDREGYEPFLEAAQNQIEEFGGNVKALNFVPHEIRIKDCLDCVYKTVCRMIY
ncbi:MAG: PD-(D/E)XK nuclease family protein [Treponema sp.]|jgi:hypothetical protein|nr:PD-(D/E)XK nuclease family protein [Treponema sp.]